MMCCIDEDAFTTDEAIEGAKVFLKEYQFRLKDISIPITVRLYKVCGQEKTCFRQSHFIYTPVQAEGYETSRPSNDTPDAALRQVIFGFTRFYNEAVKADHTPDDSWLVPNEKF